MRLPVGCNPEDGEEINNFVDWILNIGEGKIGGKNYGYAELDFPKEMLIPDSNDHIKSLITETYDNWQHNLWDPIYFQDRAILAPIHEQVGLLSLFWRGSHGGLIVEIVRILAGQVTDFAAMTDISIMFDRTMLCVMLLITLYRMRHCRFDANSIGCLDWLIFPPYLGLWGWFVVLMAAYGVAMAGVSSFSTLVPYAIANVSDADWSISLDCFNGCMIFGGCDEFERVQLKLRLPISWQAMVDTAHLPRVRYEGMCVVMGEIE
ncbi:ATP-dependent DNA helicase PIF1-like protein, partial [Tanacetum coccineum]